MAATLRDSSTSPSSSASSSSMPALRMRPTVCIDGERRSRRSVDPEIALQLQLQHVATRQDLDLLVVADLDGAPVATAGPIDDAIELADLAARVAHEYDTWQSMVASRGYVCVTRVEIGFRRFCVAAQSRFALPDRAAIGRALEGTMRILAGGLYVDAQAPIPLVSLGGWGDWDALSPTVVDAED
jgi:hypothetical protein